MLGKKILHNKLVLKIAPYILIIIVSFLAFGISISNGITNLDDESLVVGNFDFNHKLGNINKIFKEDIYQTYNNGGTYYRPILRLSFMFDAQLGKKSLLPVSHTTNIILHAIAVCLLYRLLLVLKTDKKYALMISVLLASHPLFAQTVAWIPGRNDSLLAIFTIPAFIFFIESIKRKSSNLHVLLYLFFLFLALLTKESALVIPIVSLFYIFIFESKKEFREKYLLYIKLFFASVWPVAMWFLLRFNAMHRFVGNADFDYFGSVLRGLPSALPALGKIFMPFDLSVFPVYVHMSLIYGTMTLLVLLMWFFASEKKDKKLINFGIFWFLFFVAISLIKSESSQIGFLENRLYLPTFGIAIMLSGFGKKINFKWLNSEKLSRGLLFLFLIVFVKISLSRNVFYINPVMFWNNAVENSPSSTFARKNLGRVYMLEGELEKARKQMYIALSLNPKETYVHYFLGFMYDKENDTENAEIEYRKEIELNPYYPNPYKDLGKLYELRGEKSKADVVYGTAKFLDPTFEVEN